MARHIRRTSRPRRSPRPPRHAYVFRSYAHDLQQAIAALLELPTLLRPVRKGGWTPVLALLAGLLMVFSRAATLTARLSEATAALRRTCRGFRARSYPGWSKALGRHPGLRTLLRGALRQRTGQFPPGPGRWRLLAVDGSRFNLPRTAACRRFAGRAGRRGTAPQLYLTCLYDVATGLLWDYRIGKGPASERAHLQAMLADLPEHTLLLADAGFTGYRLLAELQQRQIPFLIRAGRNVGVLVGLGIRVREERQRVYLWPERFCRARRRPLALRQIVLRRHGQALALLTNLSARQLPHALAGRLYRRRWGVEVFYRQLKQKLEKRTLQSRTPARAVLELDLAVLGLWLGGLLLLRAWPQRRPPLAWTSLLEVLRRALSAPRKRSWNAWRRRLAGCRADPYRRYRPKRGRYWPDKKHDRPCGLPRVRRASRWQRQLAQQLTPLLLAA